MSNYDAWLEQPFQDSLRHGEELEALEDEYLESSEYEENFEAWQRDCLPAIQARPSGMPFMGSVTDAYLTSPEYSRDLDAFIQNWIDNEPWALYEQHDIKLWHSGIGWRSLRRVRRFFSRLADIPFRLMRVGQWR
jgi:hypothetical protein